MRRVTGILIAALSALLVSVAPPPAGAQGARAAAAPINDSWSTATVLGLPPTGGGASNIDATGEPGEPTPTCATGGDTTTSSVWWQWVAPAAGTITIDTLGSGIDTVLAVYTGTAVNALTERACNDDAAGGTQSVVNVNAVAGTTYRIQVDGFSVARGAITLGVRGCLAGYNDRLKCATVLPNGPNGSGTSEGSNANATAEAGDHFVAGCADSFGHKTVWWSWTAPYTGTFTFDTFGSSFDTILSASSVGGGPFACNDDAGGGLQSSVVIPATAGGTYLLQVDGLSGATGNITIHVNDTRPFIRPVGVVVTEGDSGSQVASAVVLLEDAAGNPTTSSSTITVAWTTLDFPDNPAVAHPGTDYVAASGVLTIPAGQSQATVPLTVLGDTAVEPPLLYGEWAVISFSSPSANARLNTSFFGLAAVIILDDAGG